MGFSQTRTAAPRYGEQISSSLVLAEAMWRINHLHNLIEAEAYDGQEKGEERRELALMRQIVARMADAKLKPR